MAISEHAPRPQRRERKQSPDAAAIASRVEGAVDNLKRDRLTINNSHELCRRADMAMVAMLKVVAPVLPQIVKEQVQSLISIQEESYLSAQPKAQQHMQEHEQGTSPRTGSQIR